MSGLGFRDKFQIAATIAYLGIGLTMLTRSVHVSAYACVVALAFLGLGGYRLHAIIRYFWRRRSKTC